VNGTSSPLSRTACTAVSPSFARTGGRIRTNTATLEAGHAIRGSLAGAADGSSTGVDEPASDFDVQDVSSIRSLGVLSKVDGALGVLGPLASPGTRTCEATSVRSRLERTTPNTGLFAIMRIHRISGVQAVVQLHFSKGLKAG
jgi:hypothetical protein